MIYLPDNGMTTIFQYHLYCRLESLVDSSRDQSWQFLHLATVANADKSIYVLLRGLPRFGL